ncbi:hypothetical protein [Streptomyces thermoalcalitolerans]|uniref:hypothetical protein n=1 Tax=Streptomyces thermoalcalitolerans TaxID=65605 RepID=UPI0031D257E9
MTTRSARRARTPRAAGVGAAQRALAVSGPKPTAVSCEQDVGRSPEGPRTPARSGFLTP